jgi:hypothetical protein
LPSQKLTLELQITIMAIRTLYLCTYTRGNHPTTGKVQPYHWVFFIAIQTREGERTGIAHQLRGMPGAFYYPGPEDVGLGKSEPPKDMIEIGEVDDADLDKVHRILEEVWIDKFESSGWNCQDWSLDALAKLQQKNIVYTHLTRDGIKNWLKEEESATSGTSDHAAATASFADAVVGPCSHASSADYTSYASAWNDTSSDFADSGNYTYAGSGVGRGMLTYGSGSQPTQDKAQ